MDLTGATGDLLFKLLFSKERSKRMLIHLLNSIVDADGRDPIKNIEVRKTELTPEYLGGKEARLDILAETSNGLLVEIEMQKNDDPDMAYRSMFYWSELFFQQLSKGGQYKDLKKTICINILGEFNLFKDDEFWHTFHMRNDKTFEILSDKEEIHFLEIQKVREFRKDSPITWWLEYLKNPHSESIQEIGELEPIMKEAVEMFDMVTSDPQTQEFLRMREKGLRDFNSAIGHAEERGIAIGEERGKRETALKLLSKGMPIGEIADVTGLAESEIQKLMH
ncbi:MAG: Rpn family recombination-promoting nuclease/putative transposase [Holosporaceae bacterium]|jgi:predicted transposase/invertase (TIGR01784 family)|nr:Rpn family recombination-promoting nuclease/putative transposase [Holosporaceae bacterium]